MNDRLRVLAARICTAYNIDPNHVIAVDVHMHAGELPTITVELICTDADALVDALAAPIEPGEIAFARQAQAVTDGP